MTVMARDIDSSHHRQSKTSTTTTTYGVELFVELEQFVSGVDALLLRLRLQRLDVAGAEHVERMRFAINVTTSAHNAKYCQLLHCQLLSIISNK